MAGKPTYEEQEQRVKELERELFNCQRDEEALRQSRYYLDRITGGMYECLMVIDRNFIIKDVNNRFLEEYGITREEVIGRTCHEVTHRADKPCSGSEHLCPANQVLRTGKPTRVEHIHIDKRGDEMIVEIYAFPLFGEDGSVEQVVEVHHDVTERRKAEQERMKRERLEGVLEMAGAVCHELNQPLQALYVYCEQLSEALSGDDLLHKQIQTIAEKIDTMAEITRKLQDIASYQTKEYIQGTRIVDIDKASPSS